jgi:asparagine synthase (glutamine-hydrolysing)
MCGIVGKFGFPDFNVHDGLERILHRGPDGHDVVSDSDVVHGHCRLSLLDLSSASAQPFRYRGAVLSFNGEIWNFREVREVLLGLGHTFSTTGDTEVLAAALKQWGLEALQRLEGMFGFAWSDGETRILVRDRFGKVPLYALRQGTSFAWASERKAFGSKAGVADAMPAAHVLDLNTGKLSQWYSVPDRSDYGPGDVRRLLEIGVSRRMVADAPLCVLVSGGLDSAAILTLAAQLKTNVIAYTAYLDADSPDLRSARRLCYDMGIELREVRVELPDHAAIRAALSAIEIPSKAQTEIALMCLPLARQIAADGFKACLSGEAADELFGGYGNMCIKASSCDDAGWRQLRLDQLAKMARGNFVRCNKAFLAAGVECRLPFMDRDLVECVLSLSKRDCPPGKGRLKRALLGTIPQWVIDRTKETFQGGSGMADACARVVAAPTKFYNAEIRNIFGALTTA